MAKFQIGDQVTFEEGIVLTAVAQVTGVLTFVAVAPDGALVQGPDAIVEIVPDGVRTADHYARRVPGPCVRAGDKVKPREGIVLTVKAPGGPPVIMDWNGRIVAASESVLRHA